MGKSQQKGKTMHDTPIVAKTMVLEASTLTSQIHASWPKIKEKLIMAVTAHEQTGTSEPNNTLTTEGFDFDEILQIIWMKYDTEWEMQQTVCVVNTVIASGGPYENYFNLMQLFCYQTLTDP